MDKPLALCFGTERLGLSSTLLERADYHVKIPMYGFTESFNLSVSVALLLQTLKARLHLERVDWKLSKSEQTQLKIEWCKRMLNGGELLEKKFRITCIPEIPLLIASREIFQDDTEFLDIAEYSTSTKSEEEEFRNFLLAVDKKDKNTTIFAGNSYLQKNRLS